MTAMCSEASSSAGEPQIVSALTDSSVGRTGENARMTKDQPLNSGLAMTTVRRSKSARIISRTASSGLSSGRPCKSSAKS